MMHLINSLKKNIGAYLLHLLFVCIIAPVLVGSSFSVVEFISGEREFAEMIISVFIASIFASIYGAIFSVPLAIVSLFLFKWLIDSNKFKVVYFSLLGGFFGGLSHLVFIFFGLGEGQETQVFLTFVIIGSLIGLFLHSIWKYSYTKPHAI